MRQEIKWWLSQAQADYISATHSIKSKDYHTAVFSCHQTVEKSLKAVYMLKEKSASFKTHNLIELGKHLKVPAKMLTFLVRISPEYFLCRYPDASYGIPAERYTTELVEEYLKGAQEVLEWSQSQIKE